MATTYSVGLEFGAKTRGLDAAISKLKGMDGAAAKLQGQLNRTSDALKKQNTSNAQLAAHLRKLKGEYEKLTQSAKKSAAAGGAGFGKNTISRLRGLSTEINRTREAFLLGKTAAAQYRQELDQIATSASKAGRASRFSGIGKGAGAGLTAAGAFSGIPGFSAIAGGATAGGVVGGPVGAAAGAAAAAIATAGAAAVSASRGIAIWYAQLERSQIALQGVSSSTTDFKASLEGLDRISKRLNIPIGEATQQFTSLRASMAATGFSGADTLKVFENLAAANVALGGNAQQLQGILLATTQVFSKGKVTAEELRGQIGERLPGAFALFAEATNRTTAQLDKDLQDGKVSLDDFVKFTDLAGKRFGDSADKIAESGTSAGDRLKQAWEDFSRVLGPILSAAGAAIQDFATKALQAITPLLDGLARVAQLNRKGKNDRLWSVNQTIKRNEGLMGGLAGRTDTAAQERLAVLQRQTTTLTAESKRLTAELKPKVTVTDPKPDPKLDPRPDPVATSKSGKSAADIAKEQLRAYTDLSRQFSRQVELLRAKDETSRRLLGIDYQFADNQTQINEIQDSSRRLTLEELNADLKRLEVQNTLTDAARAYNEEKLKGVSYGGGEVARLDELTASAELAAIAGQMLGDSFSNSLRSVVDGTKTAQEAIADFFRSIADALLNYATIAIAQYIAIGIAKAFAGVNNLSVSGQSFGGFSGGSGFGVDATGLQGPLTPFADGGIVRKPTAALIGEAGPEAVIPLSEMHKLGMGGGDTVVNINITGGTTGSGPDKEEAAKLARMVEAATVGVIQRERRPGGLLAR